MEQFKDSIIEFLKKEAKLDKIQLETPPKPEMGDYAFPCFLLAKELKKSPNEIALELSKRFNPNDVVVHVNAIGPYINFFVNKDKIAEQTIKEVLQHKDKYGSTNI